MNELIGTMLAVPVCLVVIAVLMRVLSRGQAQPSAPPANTPAPGKGGAKQAMATKDIFGWMVTIVIGIAVMAALVVWVYGGDAQPAGPSASSGEPPRGLALDTNYIGSVPGLAFDAWCYVFSKSGVTVRFHVSDDHYLFGGGKEYFSVHVGDSADTRRNFGVEDDNLVDVNAYGKALPKSIRTEEHELTTWADKNDIQREAKYKPGDWVTVAKDLPVTYKGNSLRIHRETCMDEPLFAAFISNSADMPGVWELRSDGLRLEAPDSEAVLYQR